MNVPFDSNGNGLADSVVVEGDFNGNGQVSMQDVEDAARALSPDPLEPKSIRVSGSMVYGVADVPGPIALPRSSLLELDSRTTLDCDAGVVLEGWDERLTGDGQVIGNRDLSGGNREIHIRGCTIDGGQPETSFQAPVGFRSAVYFEDCDDCSIENSTLRNTFHACFYTRHGDGNLSSGNRYENCGSTSLDHPSITQGSPCLYVFAAPGRTTRGVQSVDDVMLRCGAPGFNVRRADETSYISDISFSRALVEDTVLPAHGIYWGCFTLRGSLEDNVATDITCRRTAGLFTDWAGGANGGFDHVYTTRHAQIARVAFESMKRAVIIGPWSTDVVLSDLSIESEDQGLVIVPPNRGFSLADSTICAARGGILFDTEGGAPGGLDPGDPAQTTTIRDTAVVCSNPPGVGALYDGVEIRGGDFQRLSLVDVDVTGVTRNAVYVHDPAQTGAPFELTIDGGRFEGVIRGEDDASIEIYGGSFEQIEALERAVITLFGSDFVATANGGTVLVGYGELPPGFEGRIAGMLADGSALDVLAANGGAASSIRLSPPPI